MLLGYHSFTFQTRVPLEQTISMLGKVIDSEFIADKNEYKPYQGTLTKESFNITAKRELSHRFLVRGKFRENQSGASITATVRFVRLVYMAFLFFFLLFMKEFVVRFLNSSEYWFACLLGAFFAWLIPVVIIRSRVIQFKLILKSLFCPKDLACPDRQGLPFESLEHCISSSAQSDVRHDFFERFYKLKFFGTYRFDVETPLPQNETTRLLKANIGPPNSKKEHKCFAGYVQDGSFSMTFKHGLKQKISGTLESIENGTVVHFLVKEPIDWIIIFPLIVFVAAIATFLYLGELTVLTLLFFLLLLVLSRAVAYLLFRTETTPLRYSLTLLLLEKVWYCSYQPPGF